MRDPGPERELLLCCARTRVDASIRDRITVLLRGGPDWKRLLESARWHQVTPLVATTLCGSFASACPTPVVERLRGAARGLALRDLQLSRAMVQVLALLESAGVAAIPYKGPVLSAMAYGGPGLRSYGDLDIWVHPWDYRFRVADVLAPDGWLPTADYSWEKSFRHDKSAAVLDVHQYLTHRRNIPFSLRFEHALGRGVEVELAGRRVRTLNPAHMLIVLCVQLAKDAGEVERSPLIKVCDIAELLGRHPALDWSAVATTALDEGVLRIVGLGLAVAERLLGVRLPEEARRLVCNVPDRDALASHVEERIFGEDDAPFSRPDLCDSHAWNAAIRERFRDRNRLAIALLHDVLVPNDPEFALARLPKPMFPLYRIIRPARLTLKYLGAALGVRSSGAPRN